MEQRFPYLRHDAVAARLHDSAWIFMTLGLCSVSSDHAVWPSLVRDKGNLYLPARNHVDVYIHVVRAQN